MYTIIMTMSQVRLNQNYKKDHSNNKAMDEIIYPIYMNREDLSKMTKQQLIEMLPGQKPNTVSAKRAGPVNQTVSVKPTGTVFKPKLLIQLAAEKLEHSIKRPAPQQIEDK